jgi:predicted ArsR family transcriptional regulator
MKNIEAVMLQLKNHGALTSGAIAEMLDMTSMGARQHLLRLEKQQMVSSFMQKAQVGRPKQLWQLTAKAHATFPDRHSDLTLHLIDSVKVIYGDEGLDKLISVREDKILKEYQLALANKKLLVDKVAALAHLRSNEGYIATIEQNDKDEYLLIENHCPICSAAKQCQNFCRSELAIFQQCVGNDIEVTREEYLLTGDRRCVYKFKQLLN